MTFDKYGRAADPNDAATCTCQGTNAFQGTNPDATFELAVCGGSLAVCSDGDPTRDVGGLGVALGIELKLGGLNSQTFAGMGPAVTGVSDPNASPSYGLENPPVNFDPQRDAGSVGRVPPQGTGVIHDARVTDLREISDYEHPTIAAPAGGAPSVRKVVSLGNSYWADWFFVSVAVNGVFNSHIVTYPCDPPVGWVVGTPVNALGQHCHAAARNGIAFLWENDLTAEQKNRYEIPADTAGDGVPVCPPYCFKDFDISTTELQELNDTGLSDPNAGIQLAIQSGEPELTRVAGARDVIGVAVLTSLTYLVDNDLRCKLGGWGNSPSTFVGRCVDGPKACAPGTAGDALCAASPRQDGLPSGPPAGGSCRACNGPFDATTNPLGLPVGYNIQGNSVLDLVAGQRIGGIAGQNADVRVPLFVVGTTGNAASDFRDIADQGSPDVDLSDMGPVDPGSSFGSGIGAGGTFTAGVDLNIDEPCCGTAGSVVWDAANMGTVISGEEDKFIYRYGDGVGDEFTSDWALTYDKGPGPNGIPGCIGDNVNVLNGAAACDQRLGFGTAGLKTNGFFATGQDDRTILYTIGSGTRPASGHKFQYRDASAFVMSTYFPSATQNPPTTNTVAAFTLRDLNVFVARSADVLVKAQGTACPLTSAGPQCTAGVDPCAALGGDSDGDTVCNDNDNCDSVSNLAQTNSDGDTLGNACDNCPLTTNENQADGDSDGDGDLCDNCVAIANADQLNSDADTLGNVCDNCPMVTNETQLDGQGGLESPLDGVGDACDNCPTIANGLAQAATSQVGNQTNGTVAWVAGQALESAAPSGVDAVGDACDNCRGRNNPIQAANFLTTSAGFWATLSGGQRDDDHDGYGNQCDGKFPNVGTNHSLGDAGQVNSSIGENRTGDTCGTTNTRPCAVYDLDVTGTNIGLGDSGRFYQMLGFPRGPRCPACGPWGTAASATTTGPLPCAAGTAGTCGPVP